MKLKSLFVVGILMVTAIAASASITINLGAGELFQSNGSTPIPAGSLVQLIASTTDSTFTSPTATSFTGGSADDIVLASFATPDNSGTFGQPIVFSLSGNLNAGDPLMLRWWPTLTTSSSAPGGGTPFGQFRTNNVENFSDINWTVPADGSNVALNFLDQAAGGSEPNSAGTASFITAAIPEPTSLAFIWVGGIAMLAVLSRRSKY